MEWLAEENKLWLCTLQDWWIILFIIIDEVKVRNLPPVFSQLRLFFSGVAHIINIFLLDREIKFGERTGDFLAMKIYDDQLIYSVTFDKLSPDVDSF
jgi:hypothetical protein